MSLTEIHIDVYKCTHLNSLLDFCIAVSSTARRATIGYGHIDGRVWSLASDDLEVFSIKPVFTFLRLESFTSSYRLGDVIVSSIRNAPTFNIYSCRGP